MGLQIDNYGNRLSGIYSQPNCTEANVRITGGDNRLSNFDIKVAANKIGIDVTTQHNQLSNGKLSLAAGATGIRLANGNNPGVWCVTDVSVSGAGNGTAIECSDPINDAVIEVYCHGVAVGLDLNEEGTSRLGSGNRINVRTFSVATPIDLPRGWQNTTERKTTNQIFIDGRQYWPARDEF